MGNEGSCIDSNNRYRQHNGFTFFGTNIEKPNGNPFLNTLNSL